MVNSCSLKEAPWLEELIYIRSFVKDAGKLWMSYFIKILKNYIFTDIILFKFYFVIILRKLFFLLFSLYFFLIRLVFSGNIIVCPQSISYIFRAFITFLPLKENKHTIPLEIEPFLFIIISNFITQILIKIGNNDNIKN